MLLTGLWLSEIEPLAVQLSVLETRAWLPTVPVQLAPAATVWFASGVGSNVGQRGAAACSEAGIAHGGYRRLS